MIENELSVEDIEYIIGLIEENASENDPAIPKLHRLLSQMGES